jgi:cytochrome c-type biogenesis protein CcmH/NrfG
MSRPGEALEAYKDALELAPNRLDSLLGARTAAAQSGNIELAKDYERKIRAEGGVIASRP